MDDTSNYLPPEFGHIAPEPNKKKAIYFLSSVVFLAVFYFLFISAPGDFLLGTVVKIEPGMGLRNVSYILKSEHLIRSRVAFESFAIIFGGDKYIKSANYFFENKLTVFDSTSYAFLSTILKQPIESPLKLAVLNRSNLCDYVTRLDPIMEGQCF